MANTFDQFDAPLPKAPVGNVFDQFEGPAKPSDTATTPTPSLQWSDVPLAALKNAPASAVHFAKDMIQPALHPIETGQNISKLIAGTGQKAGILPMTGGDYTPHADAVGTFFANRYGGMDNLKNTIATDPVGFAADISTLLTGGETALARVPGVIGKVGEVAGTLGRVTDPLAAAASATNAAGRGAAQVVGGLGTHTGADSILTAARAGREGGEGATSFLENLRGKAPAEDAVAEARSAVGEMRKQRGEAYREGMSGLTSDPTVLDFSKIDAALNDVTKVKTFKGQNLSPKTAAIRDEINGAVQGWKGLDSAEFHTVEGLDALKQKVGDIRDATQFGTPERVIADRAYQSIRKTIIDQAPEYAKVMKGYEEASKQIKEIERTLSLNPGASIDTALRKLQSVMRNNVNSNYGRRAELADFLVNAGAPNLMQKLAGQALSSWTPRGLGKLGAQIGAEMLAMTAGTAAAGGVGALAAGSALLPFMSPRLMGELSYYTGKGAGALDRTAGMIPGAARSVDYQAGRVEDAVNRLRPASRP